jgi:hypothetical protein
MSVSEAVFAIIIFFIIEVPLTRWLYRIDEIAGYLGRIANKLDPPSPPPVLPPMPTTRPELSLKSCDCCHRLFEPHELETIGIGKTVCPDCKKFIQSK